MVPLGYQLTSRQHLDLNVAKGNLASLPVVLKCNEATLSSHAGIVVDERRKDDLVDFLGEGIAVGDNLHRVPLTLAIMRLDLSRVILLNHGSNTGFVDFRELSGGRHEVASFLGRVFPREQRVVPQPHDFLLSNLDLVAKDLPVTEIIAADLNARVSVFPFELQLQDKVSGLLFSPDQPVLFTRFAGAVDFSVDDFPGTGLAVPAGHVLPVEDRNESLIGVQGDERKQKGESR